MNCEYILKAAKAHDKGYVTLSQEQVDALVRAGYVFSAGGFSPLSLNPVGWWDFSDTDTITVSESAWIISTSYTAGDKVVINGAVYEAESNHTSGVFLTDLDNDLWSKSSGGISQIDDKSPNGNHATQTTAVDQPTIGDSYINGNTVATFDGTDFLTVDYAAGLNPTEFSMFLTIKRATTESLGIITTIESAGGFSVQVKVSEDVRLRLEGLVSTANIDGGVTVQDDYFMLTSIYNTPNGELFVDGVSVNTGSFAIVYSGNTDLEIGNLVVGSTVSQFVGDVSEIIFVDSEVTD